MPPLWPVAVLALLGVAAADFFWWGGLILLLIGCWAFWKRRGTWLLAGGIGLSLFCLHSWRLDEQSNLRELLEQAEALELSGVVTRSREGQEVVLRVSELVLPVIGPRKARGLVTVRGIEEKVLPGDRIFFRGVVADEVEALNPGEPDRAKLLEKMGFAKMIWAGAELKKESEIDKSLFLWRGAELLRRKILRMMGEQQETDLGERLLRALVFGERYGKVAGKDDFEVFRLSGTMHIFAVSGLHVGMVGMMCWWLLGALRIRRLSVLGFCLVVGAMSFYAFATGLRPPALRALLMASLYLGGGVLRRRPWGLNALFAAVPIVLLFNSYDFQLVGFQLSFWIVGVMTIFVPLLWRRVGNWFTFDDYLPRSLYSRWQEFVLWIGKGVGALVIMSLVAWVASVPIVAGYFSLFTPVAILGGVMLVPAAFVMLALVFLGLFFGGVEQPAGKLVLKADKWLAIQARDLVAGLSELPGAYFVLRRTSFGEDGVLVMAGEASSSSAYLDLGGGVLIDGGSQSDFSRAYGAMRKRLGISADSFVLTHADTLHCGGMSKWAEAAPPKQVLGPRGEGKSASYLEFKSFCQRKGVAWHLAEEGRKYPLEQGVSLTVLHDGSQLDSSGLADDICLVLRLDLHGWRILFTGDSGYEIEELLLEKRADLDCDVWVTGNHGDDLTGRVDFVRAVSPKLIIGMEGEYSGEYFTEGWKAWIREEGIIFWNPEEVGAVAIVPKGAVLEVKSFLYPERRFIIKP